MAKKHFCKKLPHQTHEKEVFRGKPHPLPHKWATQTCPQGECIQICGEGETWELVLGQPGEGRGSQSIEQPLVLNFEFEFMLKF